MRVAAVIPSYNREGIVLESLASIAAQTRPADRVVVVDDASSDGTVARVGTWIRDREGPTEWRVERRESNGGVSAARNMGLALVGDCDLVGFLDSDDLWPPEMLERVVAAAEAHPEASAFVVDRRVEDSTRDRDPWMERFGWVEQRPIERIIRRGCPGPSCVVMRRTALEAAGQWNEALRYMEDFDAMARLSLQGPLVHVPGPVVRYRIGIGAVAGGAISNTQLYRDRGLLRANAVEAFRESHAYGNLRCERAYCWFRAARSAYRHGNWEQSEKRCARGLRLTPWNLRLGALWLRARIKRAFSRPSPPSSSQLDT